MVSTMKKSYIHLFKTVEEYSDKRENDYYEPWVSFTKDGADGFVSYNKTEREKLLKMPLTFEIADNDTVLSIGPGELYKSIVSFSAKTIEYSTDKENWTSITSSTGGTTFGPFSAGTNVYLRGDNGSLANTSAGLYRGCCVFSSTGHFTAKGNVMSLLSSTGYSAMTSFGDGGSFSELFENCTGLTDISKIILPAAILNGFCYSNMFRNCTSLTTAPELPATTLADYCYSNMFGGCTSLTTAPGLPATTLANYCYQGMFSGCTSLTSAPVLPATTLANNCYSSMFFNCTSLTTAPELPATTLWHSCYNSMFSNCTSLTSAPALPATALTDSCYGYMFLGCSGLITAPALPATTLAQWCYTSMFRGCTSLTNAPVLPATTLANYCYQGMFSGCTSLTSAPELPATTLGLYCYKEMFGGCTSLNYIKCLATNISASNCTQNWVDGVASTGTFVKDANMSSWGTGVNGIPNGWTVQNA